MLTLAEIIKNAATRFAAAGISTARLDAEVLLSHSINKDRAWLITHSHDALDDASHDRFQAAVNRRASREPIQYIVGTREFWGLDFIVTPDVLIPRPETELLVETSIKLARKLQREPVTIIDLCTGSGCIAVSLAKELPEALIIGVDISTKALAMAKENASKHGVLRQVQFFEGDLFQPLEQLGLKGKVDIIISNPPYVPTGLLGYLDPEVKNYEPQTALVAGPHGTELHQRIIEASAAYLRRHGSLLMEMGIGQGEMLLDMLRVSDSFISPAIFKDLAGIDRAIMARKA